MNNVARRKHIFVIYMILSTIFAFSQQVDSSDMAVVTDPWAYEVIYLGHWELLLEPAEMRHLIGRSREELRIIRNTPFARHGYRFNSEDLSAHFAQFSWYEPYTKNVNLEPVENDNALLIRSIEQNYAEYDPATLLRALSTGNLRGLEDSVFDEVLYDFIDTVSGSTPLLAAIASGNAESVEYLLSNGALPDFRASILGDDAFDPDSVGELYRNSDGDVVSVRIPSRETRHSHSVPLIFASSLDNRQIVDILLQYGADPGMYLENYEAPLLVRLARDANQYIDLFLEFGADPNQVGTYDSALSAAEEPWVIELLLDAGADPTIIIGGIGYNPFALSDRVDKIGLLMNVFDDTHFDINHIAIDYPKDSLLHVLINRYDRADLESAGAWLILIERAIDYGANPDAANRDDVTPREFAQRRKHTAISELFE